MHLHVVLVCTKAARGVAPYARLASFRGVAREGHDMGVPGSAWWFLGSGRCVPHDVLSTITMRSAHGDLVRCLLTSTEAAATKVRGGLDLGFRGGLARVLLGQRPATATLSS